MTKEELAEIYYKYLKAHGDFYTLCGPGNANLKEIRKTMHNLDKLYLALIDAMTDYRKAFYEYIAEKEKFGMEKSYLAN